MPPSEKLSGVMLTMPMTFGIGSPAVTIARPRACQQGDVGGVSARRLRRWSLDIPFGVPRLLHHVDDLRGQSLVHAVDRPSWRSRRLRERS